MKNSLRAPSTSVRPEFQKQAFIEELNEKGCYVHIVTGGTGKAEWCLNKVDDGAIPTPATFAGTAPFALYDQITHWKECSGIVFLPNTVSVLSHKHDFWSNRLHTKCSKTMHDFKRNLLGKALDKEEARRKYADYLIKNFNELNEPTQSNFYPNKKKILKLKADMALSRAKYDEMKARALVDKWPVGVEENSSKYVIHELLQKSVLDIASFDKGRLVARLEEIIKDNPKLKPVLTHPLLKIKGFNKAQLSTYLHEAKDPVLRKIKKTFIQNILRNIRCLERMSICCSQNFPRFVASI